MPPVAGQAAEHADDHDDNARHGTMSRVVIGIAGLAVVVGMLGGGWIGWQTWRMSPTFTQDYYTDRGQKLDVILPAADGGSVGSDASSTLNSNALDSSATTSGSPGGSSGPASLIGNDIVSLDTASSINVRVYSNRRVVLLEEGQAWFDVKSLAQNTNASTAPPLPLYVVAGSMQIDVTNSRFSLRTTRAGLDAGKVVVTVENGTLRVSSTAASNSTASANASGSDNTASARQVGAGQRVTVDPTGQLGSAISVPRDGIGLWRQGRVTFDQTPLVQAVAEFERYGRTGVVVTGPAIVSLPVTGTFDLTNLRQFVETLPKTLPVKLIARENGTEIVAR